MIDWTQTYSGGEVLANGLISLIVTAAGVFIGLAANAWVERRRARRKAIAEAQGLLDEMMRLSLSNAPRSRELRETLWPLSSRAMEIVANLSAITPLMPAYFQDQTMIFLLAAGNLTEGEEPSTSDTEREIRAGEIEKLFEEIQSWNPKRRRDARARGEEIAKSAFA